MSDMQQADSYSSGKGHRDENFPVASWLIRPRHRAAILAFYRFARAADDVADHAAVCSEEKLRLLAEMRQTVLGHSDTSPEALLLRQTLDERQLPRQHAIDLLVAFERDVTKLRYENWCELMDYCRYSAMPVGRFVLDVHGETQSTWSASDDLCAALQVINHLQDCRKDYRQLDRVYIPQDMMKSAGVSVEALGADRASPALRGVIEALARRTAVLLSQAKPFSGEIRDFRLALEVSVIQRLAEDLLQRLLRRDPLSECVHHRSGQALGLAFAAIMDFIVNRPRARRAPSNVASSHR